MKMPALLLALSAALPASVLADQMVGTEMQGFQEVPSVSTKATGRLRMYQLSDLDMDLLEAGRGRRTAVIRYSARKLPTPLVISVGTLCKRR